MLAILKFHVYGAIAKITAVHLMIPDIPELVLINRQNVVIFLIAQTV
jgi:hypothetical protein